MINRWNFYIIKVVSVYNFMNILDGRFPFIFVCGRAHDSSILLLTASSWLIVKEREKEREFIQKIGHDNDIPK